MINSWISSHSQRRRKRHLTSLLLRRSGMFSFGTDLGIVESNAMYHVTNYYKKFSLDSTCSVLFPQETMIVAGIEF